MQQASIRKLEAKYEDALLFIVSMLKKHEILTQTALREYAKADEDFSGSDNEIRKCLNEFEKIKWTTTNNPLKNNAKEYTLKHVPSKT